MKRGNQPNRSPRHPARLSPAQFGAEVVLPAPFWHTVDLGAKPDYTAPDGSEIRLLLDVPGGGLAEARLPAGATAAPVRHRIVEEIWFVIAGEGELWRAEDSAQEVVPLHPDRTATIPRGVEFQFHATGAGPLRVLILTVPRWPGPAEAQIVWVPTAH